MDGGQVIRFALQAIDRRAAASQADGSMLWLSRKTLPGS